MQARSPRIPSDLDGAGARGLVPTAASQRQVQKQALRTSRSRAPRAPHQDTGCKKSAGTTARVERHDVRAMLEYLLLLFSLLRATVRDREALVAENLLLRHQLAVLTRPTRRRPHLRARDKAF